MRLALLLLILPFVATVPGYKGYNGYKLMQVNPKGAAQLTAIRKMNENAGIEVDFWTETHSLGQKYVFSVAPTQFPVVARYLTTRKIDYTILVTDLSKLVQRSFLETKNYFPWRSDDPETFDFSKYHAYDEQLAYMKAVADKYQDFVLMGSIGKSFERRDVAYLQIGYPAEGQKDTLLIDAGIHAREWISSSTALYIIGQLTDPKYTEMLSEIDIVIIPNLNPDGYEYSRTHDRMWRKTRSGPFNGCYGVDPNRNFPFKWGYSGTSNNPCSEVYRGQVPLSEVECANLANFIDANNTTIKAYVTLHSYGENIIYPWGYETHTYPDDVTDLKNVGLDMSGAIHEVFGTKYAVGGSADDLYPASGASDDYSKSMGIKYVYTVELRPGDGDVDDIGYYGFELPPKYILPTAKEIFPGIMVIADRLFSDAA